MGSYKSGKKEKGTPREWLDYDSRDGNRGGRAQFSWDALRDDKTRSFYMGNSLKVDGARANMGKDMHWWTKGGAAPSSSSLSTASARSGSSSSTKSSSISAEKALMKQREKELMEKALRPTAPAVGSGSGGGIFDRSRSKRQAPDDAAPPAKRPRS